MPPQDILNQTISPDSEQILVNDHFHGFYTCQRWQKPTGQLNLHWKCCMMHEVIWVCTGAKQFHQMDYESIVKKRTAGGEIRTPSLPQSIISGAGQNALPSERREPCWVNTFAMTKWLEWLVPTSGQLTSIPQSNSAVNKRNRWLIHSLKMQFRIW